MMSEELQDSAALYVLGSLDAAEAAAFAAALTGNAELEALVAELREAAGALALTAPEDRPSALLKERVLRDIATEKSSGLTNTAVEQRGGGLAWGWAIAAMFLLFSGFLFYDRLQLRREIAQVRSLDPLMQANIVALAPANGAPATAKATVAWEPDRQSGVIKITGLPAAGSGKDYQLWAVDADHKDPVSAGILHVDASGVAQVRFKPTAEARHVKAFAISLEREGGVPKAEGPILLVGSTTG